MEINLFVGVYFLLFFKDENMYCRKFFMNGSCIQIKYQRNGGGKVEIIKLMEKYEVGFKRCENGIIKVFKKLDSLILEYGK